MADMNHPSNFIKQEWVTADPGPISAVPSLYYSNETNYFENNDDSVINSYSLPPDFLDFIDIDGSSSASDEWFSSNINVESGSGSNIEDYSCGEAITPDRGAALYEEAMKKLISYRTHYTYSGGYMCQMNPDNYQNYSTDNDLDMKEDLVQRTNVNDIVPNLKIQNSLCLEDNGDDSASPRRLYGKYFPFSLLPTVECNPTDANQCAQKELEQRMKIMASRDSLDAANPITFKSINIQNSESPCDFSINLKTEGLNLESARSPSLQTTDIREGYLDLNRNNRTDNINLFPIDEDFTPSLPSNDLFRGMYLYNITTCI